MFADWSESVSLLREDIDVDSRGDEISIELPEELAAIAEIIAAQRDETVEDFCEYVLRVALGIREPDPGDTAGEALYALAQIYRTGKLGHE